MNVLRIRRGHVLRAHVWLGRSGFCERSQQNSVRKQENVEMYQESAMDRKL